MTKSKYMAIGLAFLLFAFSSVAIGGEKRQLDIDENADNIPALIYSIKTSLEIAEKAEAFFDNDDFEKAKNCFEELLTFAESNPTPSSDAYRIFAMSGIGKSLYRMDEIDDAMALFSKVMEEGISIDMPSVAYNVAEAHAYKKGHDSPTLTPIDIFTSFIEDMKVYSFLAMNPCMR